MSLVRLSCQICAANLPSSLVCDYCKSVYLLESGSRLVKIEPPKPKPSPASMSEVVDQEVDRRAAELISRYRKSGYSSYHSRHRRRQQEQQLAYFFAGVLFLYLLYTNGFLRMFGVGP